MTNLTTPEGLAAQLGLTVTQFHRKRLENNWPHVRPSRNVFRFTPDQVDFIVRSLTRTERPTAKGGRKAAAPVKGLTKRSAARQSRASS